MKAINYKIKYLIGSFTPQKETLETRKYPKYILRLQKT